MLRLRKPGLKSVTVLLFAIWAIQAGAQTAGSTVTPTDAVKASQDAQTAAQEAKVAADEAKSAKSDAVTAAGSAKGSADAAQTSAATTDKSKVDAAAGAQTATAASNYGLAAAATAKKNSDQAVAAAGVALNGSTNVKDNVNIQVVLLPRKQAERVFSKEIARQYAVVQVTIDNKSKDAAFLLQSIFADYSGWALSGRPSSLGADCSQSQVNSQTMSCPGQVASIESRVIRGELQDAANWTWRNGFIRAAILVGAVASGIPSFSSKNALKYVGAYNGQLVPGTQIFWPDGTVTQLNRVSDLGFQTNKVIAKETSDIVYAFFPLDRFLTPGMKNIFLNAPAVFFAPAQIFVDQHVGKNCWKPGTCVSQSDVDDMKNLIEDLAHVPPVCTTTDQNNAATPGQVGTITAITASDGIVTLTVANTMNQGDVMTLAGLTRNPALNTGGTGNVPPVTLTAATNTSVSFASTATITNGSETGTATAPAKACNAQKQRDEAMLGLLTMDCPAPKTDDAKTDAQCQRARKVQELVNKISLNSTNVLVQGVMTVDVTTVPATITDITFDKGNDSPDVWTVTGTDLAGTITGRFLTGGVPSVTSIEAPAGQSDKIADYIDPKTISVVSDGSNDTKLNFKLQLKTAIPSGSKLHFQVTKYDPKDTKKTSGVNSMDFVLPVNYFSKAPSTSGKPSISSLAVDNGVASATWASGSTLTGNIAGSALDAATPNITKITVPSDKNASVGQYIDTAKLATDKSKTNDGGNLHFTVTLKKTVPSGSTITFTVTGKTAKAVPVTSDPKEYAVSYK